MFIKALFIIARKQKIPKCPSTDKMWYSHITKYYLSMKRTEILIHAAAAKSLQSCPTLCNPIDGSLPGSPVPGILQATTLEWVAISFSNA